MLNPDGKTSLAPRDHPNTAPTGATHPPGAPAVEKEALRAAIAQTADLQFQRQDLRAARETLASLEQLQAHTPETLQALGNLCFLLQDYDAAAFAFSRALAHKPKDAALWVCLALTRFRQQDGASFASCLARALALDPHNVEALKLHADCNFRQGRYPEAALLYGKLLGRHPNQVEVLLSLAKCFFQTGDLATTRLVLGRILVMDPLNAIARENYLVLLATGTAGQAFSTPA